MRYCPPDQRVVGVVDVVRYVSANKAKRLENDKVPNVLLNLCKCFSALKGFLNPQARKEWQVVAKKLKDHKDEDVAFFAAKSEE